MFLITIDGEAASGKTTLARHLALSLRFAMFPSGNLYRGVAWYFLDRGWQVDAEPPLAWLADCALSLDDQGRVFCGRRLLAESVLRSEEMSAGSAQLARHAAVRERVNGLLRVRVAALAADSLAGAVLEGRDMGSVVFPAAPLKFFLEASVDLRAERRHRQIRALPDALARVQTRLARRDHDDRTRSLAPLQPAPDAIRIDTSRRTPTETQNLALRLYNARQKAVDPSCRS